MAEELGSTPYPSLPFRYSVALGDSLTGVFQEVEGLEPEAKANGSGTETNLRLDGGKTAPPQPGGQVTLRNGVFARDDAFRRFYNAIKMNTSAGRTVFITRVDGETSSGPTWTLNDARPVRISGADLSSTGDSEVVVESLEIAYTTLVVNP